MWGKAEQKACDKLAELITSLKNAPYAPGGSITVDWWFVQWRDTYKAPAGLTQKSLGCTTRQPAFYGEQEKQLGYLGFYPGTPDISTSYIFFVG